MHKSWYQLQAMEANQANFYDYDTPIPICNSGAFGEALRRYRESEANAPDTEWRLVVISETVIISNGQAA